MSFIDGDLIIKNYSKEILDCIERNQTTIIKGPTGCGKSTYVPKLLFDNAKRVAIIEPRRIAVKSLYNTLKMYISKVSYKMRFDSEINHDRNDKSYVVVYTDGMFINEIMYKNLVDTFDYIILDEVHERSVRMDLILGVLKRRMEERIGFYKLILMSATIDITSLQSYFRAGIVNVYGKRYKSVIFYEDEPVSDYIIESFLKTKEIVNKQLEYRQKMNSNFGNNLDESKLTEHIIKTEKDINKKKDVKSKVICIKTNYFKKIDQIEEKTDVIGDILIFLPGEEDINDLYKLIRKLPQVKPYKIHGSSTDSDQYKIFMDENEQKSKNIKIGNEYLTRVILSTNICETSITIPGIKFVIDTGLCKEKIVKDNIQYLVLQGINKESADQRLGRCSRVSDGFCYRLYTKESYFKMKSVRNHDKSLLAKQKIHDHKYNSTANLILNNSKKRNIKFVRRSKNISEKDINEYDKSYDSCSINLIEIERSNLSYMFLVMASLNIDFLNFNYITYPNYYNSKYAILYLFDINCISFSTTQQYNINSEETTNIDEIDDIFCNSTLKNNKGTDTIVKTNFVITEYGKNILKNPFDINLSHFYEICKKNNVEDLGAVIISFISQENYNFLGNKKEDAENARTIDYSSDIRKLIKIFIIYNNQKSEEDRKLFCANMSLSYKHMEKAQTIYYDILNKGKKDRKSLKEECYVDLESEVNLERLERSFSYAFKHNLAIRQKDGSYNLKNNISNDNKIYIHPCSSFFKGREKYIVFVDIFCSTKKYARMVGKFYDC